MDSRLRGKDRGKGGNDAFLVVLADAGTHTSWQGQRMDSRLRGNDGLTILSSSRMRGPIRRGKDKGWIPAFAGMTKPGGTFGEATGLIHEQDYSNGGVTASRQNHLETG